MALVFKNNAKTTLSAGITDTATSIAVSSGSVFPALNAGQTFYATIDDGTNIEVVSVTARSGNTLTVVRGQDNTTNNAFSTGAAIELRLTAAVLEEFHQDDTALTASTITVDDITINGSTISDAGNFTLDIGGDISLDADSGYIRLKDGGTEFGKISQNSNNLRIYSSISDGDLLFQGNDGGTTVTALTLDMSAAGAATFNSTISLSNNTATLFSNADGSSSLGIKADTSDRLTFRTGGAWDRLIIDGSGNATLGGNLTLSYAYPRINLTDTNNDSDYSIINNDGSFGIYDVTNSAYRLTISASGHLEIKKTTDFGNTTTYGGSTQRGLISWNAGTKFKMTAASSHALSLGAGGIEDYLYIQADGKVGIGTSTVNALLHISHATAPTFRLSRTGTGQIWQQGIDSSGRFLIQESASEGGTKYTRFAIDDSGEVGIGTGSPGDLLELSGASPVIRGTDTDGGGAKINFGSGNITLDADYGDAESSSIINFKVDGSEVGRFDSSGNLGIGTTAPDNLLHVYAGDSGATLTDARYKAIIEHSGEAYLAFASSANSFAGVRFIAPSGQKAYIDYWHGTQGDQFVYSSQTHHIFKKVNTTHFTIDTDGHVDISIGNLKFGGTNVLNSGRVLYNLEQIKLADSKDLVFGAGNDLKIYHNGSHSFISEEGAGALKVKGDDIRFENASGTEAIRITDGGTLWLNYGNPDSSSTVIIDKDGSGTAGLRFYNAASNTAKVELDSSENLVITSTNELTLDVGGDISLDADGGNVYVKDAGTTIGQFFNSANDFVIKSEVNDQDLVFKGVDNSSNITALTLDMSDAGTANFNHDITLVDNGRVKFGDLGDMSIFHNGTDTYIQNATGTLIIENTLDDSDIDLKSDDGSGGTTSYIKLDGSAVTTFFNKNTRHTDSIRATFGNSSDLQVYHSGSHSYIENSTGDLVLLNNADDKDIIFQSDDGSGGTATYLTIDGSNTNMAVAKTMVFADDVKASFGAGEDLRILHNGTDSFITNYTNDLYITNTADDKDIIFRSDDGSGSYTAYLTLDGSAALTQFDKDTKHVDSVKATFGNSSDLQIYHDGSYSYIKESGTGDLRIQASTNVQIYNSALDKQSANFHTAGPVTLYYDNSAKFATSATGATVTGNLTVSGDLEIQGTTTTLNTATLDVEDKNITLNKGSGDTSSSADGAGITIQDAVDASNDASLTWDASNDRFDFSHDLKITSTNRDMLHLRRNASSGDAGINFENTSGNLAQIYAMSTGNVVIDAVADITLDAAGNQIFFKDAGTTVGTVSMTDSNLKIISNVSDKDMIFAGTDGGSEVVALTLDMSNAGNAIFNSGGEFHGSLHLDADSAQLQLGDDNDMQVYHNGAHGTINVATGNLGLDVAGDIVLDAGGGDWVLNDDGTELGRFTNSSSDFVIKTATTDKDLLFKGNDDGSIITALTIDYSDAGTAIFNHDIKLADGGRIWFGDSSDFHIHHNANGNTYIGGDVVVHNSNTWRLMSLSDAESLIRATVNSSVQLYYDNVERFATTSAGVSATGYVNATTGFRTEGASLLRKYNGSWTSGVETHDVIYNAWKSSIGDFTYVKAAGNGTSGHGMLIVGDQASYIGVSDVEQGTVTDDADNPMATTWAKFSSSGATITGNILLDDADPRLYFQTGSSHYNWKIAAQDSTNKGFEISSGDADGAATNDTYTPRIVIEADTGDVGIGTTSPAFSSGSGLEIERSGTATLRLQDSGNKSAEIRMGSDLEFASINSSSNIILTPTSNVGIGQSSPSEKLHVNGNIRVGSTDKLYFGGTTNYISGSHGSNYLHFFTNNAEKARLNSAGSWIGGITSQEGIGGTPADANSFELGRGYLNLARDDTADAKQITFGKNGAVHSYIETTSSGLHIGGANVGIGTTSPAQKLHIKDTSNPASPNGSVIIEGQRDGTANLLELRARDHSSTSSALPNGQGGIIRMNGFDGSDFEEMAFIGYQADGAAVADGDAPSRLIFGTTTDGSGLVSEKMRLDNAGRLGIGTTSPNYLLDVESSTAGVRVYNTSTHSYVRIVSGGSTNNSALYFGDSDDGTRGQITYRNNGDSMAFSTGGSEALRVDSSQRVGIGTTSPDNALHVQTAALSGRSASNGNTLLTLEHSTDTGIQFFSATQTQLRFGDAADTGAGAIIYTHSDNILRLSAASAHRFTIGGTEAMRIDSSGNVGIGTNSPSFSAGSGLEISRAGAATLRLEDTDGTTGATELVQVDADGYLLTRQSSSALIFGINSSEKMRLASNGYLGIGTSSPNALLTLNTTVEDGTSIFSTYNANTNPDAEQFYIEHNGSSVALGNKRSALTLEAAGAINLDSAGDITLDADGQDILFKDGGTQFGSIRKNGNNLQLMASIQDGDITFHGDDGGSDITALTLDMSDAGAATFNNNVTAYSDERLKDNIETLDGSKVLDMRGVSFTRDGKEGSGVIAQELEKIAPELVKTADDEMGTKSVAYGNLVGYLIEAVKSQQNQIELLNDQIKLLIGENNGD